MLCTFCMHHILNWRDVENLFYLFVLPFSLLQSIKTNLPASELELQPDRDTCSKKVNNQSTRLPSYPSPDSPLSQACGASSLSLPLYQRVMGLSEGDGFHNALVTGCHLVKDSSLYWRGGSDVTMFGSCSWRSLFLFLSFHHFQAQVIAQAHMVQKLSVKEQFPGEKTAQQKKLIDIG